MLNRLTFGGHITGELPAAGGQPPAIPPTRRAFGRFPRRVGQKMAYP